MGYGQMIGLQRKIRLYKDIIKKNIGKLLLSPEEKAFLEKEKIL